MTENSERRKTLFYIPCSLPFECVSPLLMSAAIIAALLDAHGSDDRVASTDVFLVPHLRLDREEIGRGLPIGKQGRRPLGCADPHSHGQRAPPPRLPAEQRSDLARMRGREIRKVPPPFPRVEPHPCSNSVFGSRPCVRHLGAVLHRGTG